MGRDGNQEPNAESPGEQTGPLGPEPQRGIDHHPTGDMLSDGWIQEAAQEPVPNVGDRVILHLDGSREIISPDGSRKIVHLDEYRDTSEFSSVDANTGAPGSAQARGFLGSGWREDLDLPDERRHKGKRKSRMLLAAVGGIVIVGLASGWMMSSPTGTTPATSCSSGAQCTTAEHPEQSSESPAAQPEETTDPSVEPTATVKPTTVPRVRESRTSRSPSDGDQKQRSPAEAESHATAGGEQLPQPGPRVGDPGQARALADEADESGEAERERPSGRELHSDPGADLGGKTRAPANPRKRAACWTGCSEALLVDEDRLLPHRPEDRGGRCARRRSPIGEGQPRMPRSYATATAAARSLTPSLP